jgi:TM2 domain-containing membrane protein YozV
MNHKSKLLAGITAIFLGTLGIHNFYLGYTREGIPQLLMSVLGFIFGTVLIIAGMAIFFTPFALFSSVLTVMGTLYSTYPVISGIWGLIDGVMILTGREQWTSDAR